MTALAKSNFRSFTFPSVPDFRPKILAQEEGGKEDASGVALWVFDHYYRLWTHIDDQEQKLRDRVSNIQKLGPVVVEKIEKGREDTVDTARTGFGYYRNTWTYLGRGIQGTRHALNTGLGLAGPDLRYATELGRASTGLKAVGVLGAPIAAVGVVEEGSNTLTSAQVKDQEGTTLALAGMGLNIGDLIDAGLTIGAVAAEVTGNLTWAALSFAILPLGITLTSVGSIIHVWKLHRGHQFLKELKEIPEVKKEEEPDFKELRAIFLGWLEEHVGITAAERQKMKRKLRTKYPKLTRKARRDKLEKRCQRLMEKKAAHVKRRSNEDVVARLQELYVILKTENPAPVEDILAGLERVRLARCLVQRKNRVLMADIGSGALIIAGLGAFYIPPVAPYLPFALLALGAGVKISTRVYEAFFVKRGLELLEQAIRSEEEPQSKEDPALCPVAPASATAA